MCESYWCRLCEEAGPTRTIPVLLPGQRSEEFCLCWRCWRLLELGLRRTAPDGAAEPFLDGAVVRLTEPQLRSLVEAGFQSDGELPGMLETRHDLGRRRLVRGGLREIEADLKDAVEASARDDWAASLEAVRMIQGRAVVTRRVLEGILRSYPATADLPPLVRAVQAVGRVISNREVDGLPPDELRARMRAVLQALDHELQLFLDPPEVTPVQVTPERDASPGGLSFADRP